MYILQWRASKRAKNLTEKYVELFIFCVCENELTVKKTSDAIEDELFVNSNGEFASSCKFFSFRF